MPFSGVQMCDLELPRALGDGTKTHFIEELFDSGGVPQRVLLPLDSRFPIAAGSVMGAANPGSSVVTALDRMYHPVTGRVVDPAQVLTLEGSDALAAFAGQWVPLPYLRFVGRDDLQRPKFDAGPTNWVRAYVAPFQARSDAPFRITLAFDTSLDAQSRLDSETYLVPNVDDAAFGSTFICAEAVDDVSALLSEPWLESWLADAAAPAAADAAEPETGAHFQHRHFAHYLTLLRLLAAAEAMPEVRFTDTIQKRFPVQTIAVDLVVDIGEAETTALLVDVSAPTNGDQPGAGTGYAEQVRLRDLAAPQDVHEGPFPTAVEFNVAPFGPAGLSRESGRLDAFAWPSLVRIGVEAQRLSLRGNGVEGVTGLSNLRAFLLDDAPSPGLWRQSTDDRAKPGHGTAGSGAAAQGFGTQGPMVSGELLGFIGENGSVIGAERTDPSQLLLTSRLPAIRPRFSRSSMIGFFAAELVLHALTQINGAVREGRDALENEVRELRQVVVLAPSSLSAPEQQALLDHVNAGLVLVWRALGWERPACAGIPKRPEAVLSLGGDLGTQVAFLHNEVTTKYQGRFVDLLRVYRGGETAGQDLERLRVASVDFGGRATSLTIVDYAAADGPLAASEWAPDVQLSERLPTGTDAALQALIWSLVLPAIEARLTEAGLNPARHFLDEITGRSATSLLVEDPYFTRRLNRKVLWPAARGLFALNEHGAASAAYGNRALTLATLVGLGGGRLDDVAIAFDAAALQAGARGFVLAETKVDLNRGEASRRIREEMRDCVLQVSRVVAAHGCDLLLIGGDGTRLPAVREAVLAALPVPASRIIDLNASINQTVSEALGTAGAQASAAFGAALLPAIATALDRRHLLESSGFGSQALRQLALPPPPAGHLAIGQASGGPASGAPNTTAQGPGPVPMTHPGQQVIAGPGSGNAVPVPPTRDVIGDRVGERAAGGRVAAVPAKGA